MAEIVQFIPKSEKVAKQNLDDFIVHCKERLTVFGQNLDWTNPSWYKVVNFTKLGAHSRAWTQADVLDAHFIEFAKAYIRYQQGNKPTKVKNEVKALRCIEAALVASGIKASIDNLTPSIADKAAQVARENYSALAAYHAGREIERLIKFVCDKKLIANSFIWKSPLKKPSDMRIATGEKAKKIREQKLPDEEALLATAEVFNKYPDLSPRDIFTTSCVPILLSVPARIHELIHLPVDCLVHNKDKKGNEVLGLRWHAGKGFGAEIKWVPEVMRNAVEEAIHRIQALTERGRKLAAWYEEHPNEFFRHEKCPNVDDDKPLIRQELAAALNIKDLCNVRTGVKTLCGGAPDSLDAAFTLRQLNQHLRHCLPDGFPWLDRERNLKWSDALFCMRLNEINDARPVSLSRLWIPSINLINEDLGPKPNRKSLFERHGYEKTLKVTSSPT